MQAEHLEKRGHVNKRNRKGSSLLVGNIFYAHCGNRLTLTTSGRKKNRNVPMAKYIRYQCHYNVRHPGECDGQSGYSVPKVDSMVEQVVRMKLAEIEPGSYYAFSILARTHEAKGTKRAPRALNAQDARQ